MASPHHDSQGPAQPGPAHPSTIPLNTHAPPTLATFLPLLSPPQGLCTCCSLGQECFFPSSSHGRCASPPLGLCLNKASSESPLLTVLPLILNSRVLCLLAATTTTLHHSILFVSFPMPFTAIIIWCTCSCIILCIYYFSLPLDYHSVLSTWA